MERVRCLRVEDPRPVALGEDLRASRVREEVGVPDGEELDRRRRVQSGKGARGTSTSAVPRSSRNVRTLDPPSRGDRRGDNPVKLATSARDAAERGEIPAHEVIDAILFTHVGWCTEPVGRTA